MKTEDFIDIINELNDGFQDELTNSPHSFNYSSNGYEDMILFNDQILWCSENENRKFIEEIDEYEPLLPYLKNKFNDYVNELNKINRFNSNDDNNIIEFLDWILTQSIITCHDNGKLWFEYCGSEKQYSSRDMYLEYINDIMF